MLDTAYLRLEAREQVDIAERVASWTRDLDLRDIEDAAARWDACRWSAARFATQVHGVGPLLHARLPDTTALPPPVADFRAFLREAYSLNQRRAARWLEQLEAIALGAERAGVLVVALKGAAIVPWLLGDPALRPTADIDLLVPPGARVALDATLRRLGYAYGRSTGRHHQYFLVCNGTRAVSPFGEHPDNPLRLELHEHAVQDVLGLRFDATSGLRETASPSRLGEATLFVPAAHATLQHVLFHAAQDMVYRTCRLVKLHDVAMLAARVDQDGWRAIVNAARSQRVERFFLAALALAERYVHRCAPRAVVEELAAATPGRTLTFVERVPLSELTRCEANRSGLRWLSGMFRWGASARDQGRIMRRLLAPTLDELQDAFGTDQAAGRLWYYRRHARKFLPSGWAMARGDDLP